MNKLYLIAIGALLSGIITVQAQEWKPQQWPVLKKYDKEHLYQIALPLGGIGTGTVSLGGRGELRDWEIMNVPAKKYSTVTTGNNAPFEYTIHIKAMLLSLQSMPNRKTRKRLPHCWQDHYIRMNIYIMKDVLSIIMVFRVLNKLHSRRHTLSDKFLYRTAICL